MEGKMDQMKKIRLTKKYLALLKKADKLDEEMAHGKADHILCDLLEELGYGDIADEFNSMRQGFWYA